MRGMTPSIREKEFELMGRSYLWLQTHATHTAIEFGGSSWRARTRHFEMREAAAGGRRRPAEGTQDDRQTAVAAYRASSNIMSEAFSAIMMIGALVFPDTRSGMIEPSTTRRPSSPLTFSRWSTTASASLPMRQDRKSTRL